MTAGRRKREGTERRRVSRPWYLWWRSPARRSSWIFIACFFAPIILSFVRKFVPGQPPWVRSAAFGVMVASAGWAFLRKVRIPRWLTSILVVWAGLQFLYLIPTGFTRPRMFPFVAVVYFVPLLLPKVTETSLVVPEDVLRACKFFGGIVVLLFPLAIIATLWGNEILPFWLQATEKAQADQEVMIKGVFTAPSLIFATPRTLGHTLLGIVYLLYVGIGLKQGRGEQTRWWWLVVAVTLITIYLLGRRAVMMSTLPGLAYGVVREKKGWRNLVIVCAIFLGFVYYMDEATQAERGRYRERSEIYQTLDFERRFWHFWEVTEAWVEADPFGNYLGYASPIARSFDVENYEVSSTEFGASVLVAEMGVFGLLAFPFIVGLIIFNLLQRSTGLRCRGAVVEIAIFLSVMFVLFYVKTFAFLMIGTLDHLFFWASVGLGAGLIYREKQCWRESPYRER